MLGRGLESLIPPQESGKNYWEQSTEASVLKNENDSLVPATLVGSGPGGGALSSGVNDVLSGSETVGAHGRSHESVSFDSEVGCGAAESFLENKKLSSDNHVDSSGFGKPAPQEAVFQIEVDKIEPNPFQPRKEFNEEELRELASSIREYGIIQPLVVSKIEEEAEYGTRVRYQLIAGERRLRAAKLVGLERVPAIIKHVDTKKLNLELAIIENVQRADLNPLEAARAYARLQDEFNLTQREIAVRVGKSRESVANSLRLLSLPSFIQEAVQGGKINESQARVLLSIADLSDQKNMFFRLLDEKMTVRQLKRKVSGAPDPESNYLERQLEERLGAPVEIKKRGAGGKLVIKWFSSDEMKGVLQRLLGDENL